MRWYAFILLLMAASPVSLAVASASTSTERDVAVRVDLAAFEASDPALWDVAKWKQPLVALYASRSYAPLWFSSGRLTTAASELLSELQSADLRGLLPADYDLQWVRQSLASPAGPRVADVGRMDVAISVAAARLASDLRVGRIKPFEVGYHLDVPGPTFDAADAVRALASSPNVRGALDALEPRLRHFLLLKTALARYRALALDHADLVNLPVLPRARLRPGESYLGAPALRRLLEVLGDLPNPAQPSESNAAVFDPVLVEGMKRFQARHGLEPDGVLGRGTFLALTTPFRVRARQIELSLERIRWLPPFDTPPIIVNIPQFRLFAFRSVNDAADDILQMNVIVGAAFKARRTPVFAANMRYVVLQPYWDVPRSILVKELLPEIHRDPRWLVDNGYEIVRGESDNSPVLPPNLQSVRLLEQGTARLRQKPGSANALGRVKFIFPNEHNVYLHDTPARSLFSRSRRAFSHGCIRVADPMGLLAHVMRNEPGWTDERRDEALARDTPTRVPLSKPIQVFILYGTALANEDGTVQFFDDLYGQDAPLIAKLSTRRLKVSTVPAAQATRGVRLAPSR